MAGIGKQQHHGDGRSRSARRRSKVWLQLATVGAIVAMVATGCSSNGGEPATGSTGGADDATTAAAVKTAQDLVTEWSAANSTWQGPTESPALKPGIKLAIIVCDQKAEGCARPARAQQEAAEMFGWNATLFDGQGNPAKQLEAINAAVDAHFDAIILDLVDTRTTQEGIQRALKANIPMISVANLTNEPASIPEVSHDWVFTGQLAADYMIAKSNGSVNALILLDNEFEVVKNGEYKGIMSILEDKTKCPDCKTTVKQFQIANLESQPGGLAVAALQQDPTINWVWCFDACMSRVASQVIASGISTEAKGIGMNGNAQNLQLIMDDQFQVMTVANPYQWEAWAAMDNLRRMLAGEDPVDQKIPVRIFDKSNVSELPAEEVASGWNGGLDYVAEYKKLWSIGK
jgi:ribose transport system substrate-binding protein